MFILFDIGLVASRLLGGYSKSYDFGSFDWEFDQFTLNMLVGAVLYLINFLVSIFGMSVIHKNADEEGKSSLMRALPSCCCKLLHGLCAAGVPTGDGGLLPCCTFYTRVERATNAS